ncbi:hypothetical protein NYZ99_11875 [Maribacter litopenaei]|uniref:Uncharacterized protein n=1 Tax=Maribacter litopenaei TaxID=2976127 RepID=A0ABY5Y584_9FLAO|nr:hypothetical protein [Maribacter litopenaei]UWX53829.1 hypothetical protein NYZ99_11875 [Maribacter litopenaei]
MALELIDDETKIIPGHGAISSKTDLKDFTKILITLRERVKETEVPENHWRKYKKWGYPKSGTRPMDKASSMRIGLWNLFINLPIKNLVK